MTGAEVLREEFVIRYVAHGRLDVCYPSSSLHPLLVRVSEITDRTETPRTNDASSVRFGSLLKAPMVLLRLPLAAESRLGQLDGNGPRIATRIRNCLAYFRSLSAGFPLSRFTSYIIPDWSPASIT